jgi:hypothetical protein
MFFIIQISLKLRNFRMLFFFTLAVYDILKILLITYKRIITHKKGFQNVKTKQRHIHIFKTYLNNKRFVF